jgi:predicted transposase/invertase (TIGR01784 family)
MYLDEKEKGYYDAQQKFWLDQNAFIKETVEKAVEKAVEQAELNRNIEIAKSLFQTSLSNEEIAKHTNLTIEQIEQLRHEKQ